jgi:hypothetical protein
MKKLDSLLRLVLMILLMMAVMPQALPAAEFEPLSITLEEYSYPYPVSYLPLTIEGQNLKMAYIWT